MGLLSPVFINDMGLLPVVWGFENVPEFIDVRKSRFQLFSNRLHHSHNTAMPFLIQAVDANDVTGCDCRGCFSFAGHGGCLIEVGLQIGYGSEFNRAGGRFPVQEGTGDCYDSNSEKADWSTWIMRYTGLRSQEKDRPLIPRAISVCICGIRPCLPTCVRARRSIA
jgi:hypothetical protein